MYDLFHIWTNLRKNMSFYLILFLELVLCFAMMLAGLDEKLIHSERKAMYQSEDHLVTLTDDTYFLTGMSGENHSFFKEDAWIYGQILHLNWMTDSGQIETIKLVQANRSFFKECFKAAPSKDDYYADLDLIDHLSEGGQFLSDPSLSGTDQTINPQKIKAIVLRDPIPTSIFEYADLNPERTLFIFPSEPAQTFTHYFIKLREEKIGEDILQAIEKIVGHPLNPTYLLADFADGSEQLGAYVRLFGWIAIIALLIVIFGSGAMILIFVHQRHEKLNIQYYFGASPARLRRQLFLELFAVFLSALITSIVLCYLIYPHISSAYYTISLHFSSIIILFFVAVCVCLLLTMMSQGRLRYQRRLS